MPILPDQRRCSTARCSPLLSAVYRCAGTYLVLAILRCEPHEVSVFTPEHRFSRLTMSGRTGRCLQLRSRRARRELISVTDISYTYDHVGGRVHRSVRRLVRDLSEEAKTPIGRVELLEAPALGLADRRSTNIHQSRHPNMKELRAERSVSVSCSRSILVAQRFSLSVGTRATPIADHRNGTPGTTCMSRSLTTSTTNTSRNSRRKD